VIANKHECGTAKPFRVPFVVERRAGRSAASGHCGRKLKVRYRTDIAANQYYCVRRSRRTTLEKFVQSSAAVNLIVPPARRSCKILAPLGIERHWHAIDSGQDCHRISADKPNWH